MRYLKPTTALLTILCLLIPLSQVSAYGFSLTQTTDADFNGGTNSQTAVDTGNGRVKLDLQPTTYTLTQTAHANPGITPSPTTNPGNFDNISQPPYSGTGMSNTTGSGNSVGLTASFSCGQNITYNSDTYSTVLIGTQCWLADNLRTTLKPDGSALTSYCYTGTGCAYPWGRIYDWTTMMNGATTATGCGAKIQGICPNGWHIPSAKSSCTNDDFYLLSTYLGGSSVSGGALKVTGTTYWQTPNTGATNSSGFSGVGAGFMITPSSFTNRYNNGQFFSSYNPSGNPTILLLLYNTSSASIGGTASNYDNSVRCIKDNSSTIYNSSGTYTSYVDAGTNTISHTWNTFTWNQTLNSGTIGIQVKSTSTPTAPSYFTDNGQVGGNTCASSSSSPINLSTYTANCVNNSDQYLWYQVTFTSPTGAENPTLDQVQVSVTNNNYYSSGTYTSAVLPVGGAANWGTVSWNRTLNSQPEITLKVRSCANSSESSCVNYASGWGACNDLGSFYPSKTLSSSGCTTNLQRFIQYQVGLSSNSPYTVTPTFDEITFAYDIVPDVIFSGGFQFIGTVKLW